MGFLTEPIEDIVRIGRRKYCINAAFDIVLDVQRLYREELPDVIKLDQVIYNLINNAINYSGEDHQVIVKQLLEQGRVRIEIIDHGPGIEKDKLAYIWERYYKVDKTHVRSRVGSGLGLSIVKAVLGVIQARHNCSRTYL